MKPSRGQDGGFVNLTRNEGGRKSMPFLINLRDLSRLASQEFYNF